MSLDEVVVFGVPSDGSTEQWDGHSTTPGVLLRWFVDQDLGFPDLGFDVYRAQVSDVAPLPFNDLNVPLIQGQPTWDYAGLVTLSCPTGLQFAPSGQVGWWQLLITPTSPVTITFSSPAWLVQVNAGIGPVALEAVGRVAGAERRRDTLDPIGSSLVWRTRGIESVDVTGDGALSFVGYHLLGDPASWTHLAHRCLPVIDPAYPCGPTAASEATEAQSRLPAPVAAEWSTRFDAPFATMLPALRRLATRQPAIGLPIGIDPLDGRLATDEAALIELASLDPHVARIMGLAYDDPLGGAMDGREFNYKVVGTWLTEPFETETRGLGFDPLALQVLGAQLTLNQSGRRITGAELTFDHPVRQLVVEMDVVDVVDWLATDQDGATSTGTLPPRQQQRLELGSVANLTLLLTGVEPTYTYLRWQSVEERFGLLTGVIAIEPGPPAGPPSLAATVSPAASPSAIAIAALDWDVPASGGGSLAEGAAVAYQVGRRRILADPTAPQPAPDPPRRVDLLYVGAPVYPAEEATTTARPRTLHLDRNDGGGLAPGWWGWWTRGVDLFGRVSTPSAWGLAAVTDSRPPPPPVLLAAEYVQPDLPAQTAASIGRSAEARRWVAANPTTDGLVVSWAFGPDDSAVCPDADGFRLLLRKPIAVSGAPAGSPLVYPEPWPTPIRAFGPLALWSTGAVNSVSVDPALGVVVGAVTALPRPPDAAGLTASSVCLLDLDLDAGSGVFVGGTLTLAGATLPVVANGEGTDVSVTVDHDPAAAPSPGTGQLTAKPGTLVSVATSAPALAGASDLRPRSGVLVVGTGAPQRRLRVLHASEGAFLCLADGSPPITGDAVEWYPAWTAAIADTGFGPSPSEAVPVVHAQVAVRAVRRYAAAAVESAPSSPLTVTAVDVTEPQAPTVTAISFQPGDRCARLATRADWYGHSHFTLGWGQQAGRSFVVYRALGDEIFRLDLVEHDGDSRNHSFTNSADWPPGVFTDASRKARVVGELAALDAARATAGAARADAVAAAYDAMTIDSQCLLARQPYSRPAFVALTNQPIEDTNYEDVLDGRSRAHWYYCVASRTQAGLESALSEPTPPICCPDVVPPAVPVAYLALADAAGEKVRLSWLASPDTDLDHYHIYAARHPDALAELDGLTPVDTYMPNPHQPGVIVERSVKVDPDDWCFRIVAVDTSGNASQPSAMLRGRPIVPPPGPPVWDPPNRTATAVELTWTHPDQRLACSVERRVDGLDLWSAVSGWLPRGQYSFDDVPGELAAAQEYRLRVRDTTGQPAATMPAVSIAEGP